MFTLYSKPKCSQCDQAKLLLDVKKIKYEVKQLDVDFTRDELLELYPTARSYPVILKDGVLIGSLANLKQII